MSAHLRPVGVLLAAVALASPPAPAEGPAPWEAEFEGKPAAILAAAANVAPAEGQGAVLLLEEGNFTFDEQGRLTERLRQVVRIVTPAAVDGWSSFETAWAPWYQARPELQARVLTSDGAEHLLDPKTVTDAPLSDDDPDLFTDRRVARAPLPAVSAGSVVEQVITIRDTQPYFAGGSVYGFSFGWGPGTERTRLTVRYPESLPLKSWTSPRLALEPVRTVRDGVVTLVWESGHLAPLEDLEPGVPGEIAQTRFVKFATGESWNRVARRYAEIVDAQLGAAAKVTPRPPADRDETIRQIYERLQREIRYTGVEFSEASIVPRSPAETAKRRYGDCKDKAALLVARLREAGIPSSVALLSVGGSLDTRPELPGLGFDHAIVYVPGPAALWIDPTDEFSKAGMLPHGDQGRWALVADAATTDLVRTPESTSAENRRIETREFRLRDEKKARAVEIREATGGREREERLRFAGSETKDLKEWSESYGKEEYVSSGPVRYEMGDPRDLSRPFRVRLEFEEAGRGITEDEEASVALFPSDLLRGLPRPLRPSPDADNEPGATAAAGKKPKARQRDFVFAEPYVDGWRYRVVPPAGYVAAELPPSSETAVGAGRLTQSYLVENDGAISATLLFDSGKRRLTPAEFEAYKKAAAAILKSPPVFLRFTEAGMARLQAGQVREALVHFRKLAAGQPKQARPRSRISLALLSGGLGDAARKEARSAVALEPDSAAAHRTLAWVLQHDLLGRRFSPGFDRDGAIAEYRKAKQLDPKDLVARGDLAILLEHDPDGVRFGEKADLAGAIAEYQAIRSELKEKVFDLNLLVCLYQSRRFDELEATVRSMERSEVGDQCLVLAATARLGVEAGLREAQRLFPDAARRRESLERVGQTLVTLRLYPEAAAFLSEAANGSPKASDLRSRADAIRRARRWDAEPLPESDPRTVAKRFFVVVVNGKPEHALPLFTTKTRVWLTTKDGGEALAKIFREVRRPVEVAGVSRQVLLDLILSESDFASEGSDATGYRVRLQGGGGGRDWKASFFVVKEDGAFRIVSSEETPGALGEEAVRRLDAKDFEGARIWLDWARELVRGPRGEDSMTGAPFARLWTRGVPVDEARTRLAALTLAVEGETPAAWVGPLVQAGGAARDAAERQAVDLALLWAYVHEKQYTEILAVTERLGEAAPTSAWLFVTRFNALSRLGRSAEARRLAEERLGRLPEDPAALRSLAGELARSGDVPGALRLERRLVERGSATAVDYNDIAWFALVEEKVDEQAIRDGQRAVEMSGSSGYASLHTLASLYAETGKTMEARELILKAIAENGREEPRPDDWYVFGRIAEQYGESAAAIDAYRRVEAPPAKDLIPTSTWALAKRRLAVLEASGAPSRKKS